MDIVFKFPRRMLEWSLLVERISPIMRSPAHKLQAGEEVNTDGSPHRASGAPRVNREGQLVTTKFKKTAGVGPGGPAPFLCSVARRVAGDETVGGRGGEVPAGAAALFVADRVEAQPGDLDEGVAGVGVDGDPLARAGGSPAHQGAGVQRARDQAAAEEGEADRA